MPAESQAQGPSVPRWKRAARIVLIGGGLAAAVLSLAGRAGLLWWVLDLWSHWRVQYLAAFLVVAAGCLVLRSWRWAAGFAILSLVELVSIVPLYLPGEQPAVEGRTWRLAAINTWAYGGNEERVVEAIRHLDPDIVVLVEISAELMRRTEEMHDEYPWRFARPAGLTGAQKEPFGLAVLSRAPILESTFFSPAQTGVMAIDLVLDLDGRPVRLVATHLYPPVTAHWAGMRNAQIEDLAARLAGRKGPALLCGDLNLTPWSPWFGKLVGKDGLRDSALGFGVQPTWPARFPLLGIPIDHCLHTPGVVVTDRFTGLATGSDHLPLVVEFGLSPQAHDLPLERRVDEHQNAVMRLTIGLSEAQGAALREVAERRGLADLNQIVGEAVDLYLRHHARAEAARAELGARRGTWSAEDASHARATFRRLRGMWPGH